MINYNDIKLKVNPEYNTFIFNNQEVKVLKYLPISEKFDLIMTAIQKSVVNGIHNPVRLNTFFKLNIAYLYTDVMFTMEDRIDEGALYDELHQNGFFTMLDDAMDGVEKLELYNLFNECLTSEKNYRTTAAAIIAKLVDDLPKNAEATKEIVDNFDENKFSQVLAFAKAIQ